MPYITDPETGIAIPDITTRTPEEIARWAEANREPLRFFWAKCPADALALKKVIESRGGSVAVESAPGEGATFRFTWPKD